jgi:hypothetical protein
LRRSRVPAYDPIGMFRAAWAWISLLPLAAAAHAGTVTGKLELPPPPPRPPLEVKGFLDRVENPLAPVKPLAPATRMVVVLEGDEKPVSPPQVVVELLGETFSKKVVAAPAGAEVLIKNVSKTARTLAAAEDPKLVPQGPINPTGPKSFRVTDVGKVYTIGDKDAPHLQLKIVVVNAVRRLPRRDRSLRSRRRAARRLQGEGLVRRRLGPARRRDDHRRREGQDRGQPQDPGRCVRARREEVRLACSCRRSGSS